MNSTLYNTNTNYNNNLIKRKSRSKYQIYSMDLTKNSSIDFNNNNKNINDNNNIFNNQDLRSSTPKKSPGFTEFLKKSKVLSKLQIINNSSIYPNKIIDVVS